MSLADELRLELDELCNACADGCLSDAQRCRLERLLADSAEARKHYVRFAGLSASLHEYAGEPLAEAPDLPPGSRRLKLLAWSAAALAAAAAVVLVIGLGAPAKPGTPGQAMADNVEAPDTVAILTAAADCRWNENGWQPGDSFLPGQRLELLAGFAEIAFDCGARVLLEGPVDVLLTSAWEVDLRKGTLRANVPPEAIGFRVANPEVDIVDLGTDFSVVTDDHGSSEVFVHEGAVEVQPKKDPRPTKRILHQRESLRFASVGMSPVKEAEKKFAKLARKVAMKTKSLLAKSVHWGFDAGDQMLPSLNVPRNQELVFGSGPWGRTLQFDGSFSARAQLPDFSAATSRSVAWWVRVPADSALPESAPMLSWRLGRGPILEIGWNRDPGRGVVGALQTRVGQQLTAGSTQLRDGKWHHVAVVLTRRQKEKEELLVKLYVDGRLEAKSHRQVLRRSRENADAPQTGEVVLFGRAFGPDAAPRFRGELDEIFLTDGILTQAEIRALVAKNVIDI